MTAAYDPSNVFAKILRGEIPCHKVYEDEHTLAFMDVMPQGDGHTLVVPKTPARNILDAQPVQLERLILAVQAVAKGVKAAFYAPGVQVIQFNEPASGQTVFHLHFHVIPRFDGVPLKPHTGQMADHGVLAEHAARVREALGRG